MADEETQGEESVEEMASRSSIMDPMSLRDTDTSRLKRIKPQTSLTVQDSNAGDEFGTETVHLKVIKEKKKQLAGILSASQTIRLRPSANEAAPAAPAEGAATAETPAAEGEMPNTARLKRKAKEPDDVMSEQASQGRPPTLALRSQGGTQNRSGAPTSTLKRSQPGAAPSTLKIKAPAGAGGAAPAGDSRPGTLKLKAPGAAAPTQAGPTDAGDLEATQITSKSTLKFKAPAVGDGGGPAGKATLKVKAAPTGVNPPATDGGQSTATLKIKAPTDTGATPAAGGGKATLKLKAPTSGGAAGGGKPGTLKLKAPTSPGAAETVKQEAPAPGKTLKLRSDTGQAQAAPQAAPGPAAAQEPEVVYVAPTGT
jgi:hypothetical protein